MHFRIIIKRIFRKLQRLKVEKKLYTCSNSSSISVGYKGVKFLYSIEIEELLACFYQIYYAEPLRIVIRTSEKHAHASHISRSCVKAGCREMVGNEGKQYEKSTKKAPRNFRGALILVVPEAGIEQFT